MVRRILCRYRGASIVYLRFLEAPQQPFSLVSLILTTVSFYMGGLAYLSVFLHSF